MTYVAPSDNAKAVLLLTARLTAGGGRSGVRPLAPREYNSVGQRLRELQGKPADLLRPAAAALLKGLETAVDRLRLEALLDQGFALGQALDRWQARSIWVLSRADEEYPQRLRQRLGQHAPALLYGCGSQTLLDTGGLAVVGSRKVGASIVAYTEQVGRLAAETHCTVVSGGARGVDRAAMSGALQAGGRTVGILPSNLEQAALLRDNREPLLEERLALVSPYDPATRFFSRNAMQRNKFIYLLADTALVVASDYGKGGTWSGASEQLEKYRAVPIFVASTGDASPGLRGLADKGAKPWPEPANRDELEKLLAEASLAEEGACDQESLPLDADTRPGSKPAPVPAPLHSPSGQALADTETSSARELSPRVRELIVRECQDRPKSPSEIAATLQVPRNQANQWLQSMVEDGSLARLARPVRFRAAQAAGSLFGPAPPPEP